MVDFNADPKIKVKGVKGNVTINFNSDTLEKKANPTEIGNALGGQGAPIGDNVSFSTKAVNSEPKPEPKPEQKPELKSEPKPEFKPEQKPVHKQKPHVIPKNVNNGNINNGTQAQQHGKYNINAQNGSTVIINNGTASTKDTQLEKPVELNGPEENQETKNTNTNLERLADQIHDAIKGLGTDDEKLGKALKLINKDNIVELVETYNKYYPDMFENVLDDLSGKKFTEVANKFKVALLERLKDTSKYADAQRLAGKIEGELRNTISFESYIAKLLNQMVGYAKEVEK